MNTRILKYSSVLLAACVLGSGVVLAEVAAEVDHEGEYLRTVVLGNASLKNLRVWEPTRNKQRSVPLNPEGDLNGDLWPEIRENPFDEHRAWVVWSRFNGIDYDLAWARWTDDDTWSPVAWLSSTSDVGNAVEPDIDFALSDGRPHVVWTVDEGDHRQVFLSLFLNTRWMSPYRVSDLDVDSWNADLVVLDDDTIEVTYDTEEGPVTRIVVFARPTTITDDVDPLDYFTVRNGS